MWRRYFQNTVSKQLYKDRARELLSSLALPANSRLRLLLFTGQLVRGSAREARRMCVWLECVPLTLTNVCAAPRRRTVWCGSTKKASTPCVLAARLPRSLCPRPQAPQPRPQVPPPSQVPSQVPSQRKPCRQRPLLPLPNASAQAAPSLRSLPSPRSRARWKPSTLYRAARSRRQCWRRLVEPAHGPPRRKLWTPVAVGAPTAPGQRWRSPRLCRTIACLRVSCVGERP